jgi:hypothetical protein
MWPAEDEEGTPGSIDPTGIWRLGFWLIYVFGNLGLVFGFLLAQVPSPRRHDPALSADLAVWLCTVVLFLTSILMARWLWKIKNPVPRGPLTSMHIIILVAWGEVAIAFRVVIGVAIRRWF